MSHLNISRKQASLAGVFFLFIFLSLNGCGPKYTYPADKVPKAVEDITLKEYHIRSKVRVVGKTIGALVNVNSITDETKQISKETNEKMGKLLQSLTRVALSTDLPIEFCVAVLRDRSSNNELVIIRSVEDTKRANAEVIGVEESINRTVFGQTKYTPAASGQDSFVLKEVTLENFLADQIVQRIRFNFSKEAKSDGSPLQPLILADGNFEKSGGKRIFQFSVIDFKKEDQDDTLAGIFNTVNRVFEGYKFDGFDEIEIKDYAARKKMTIDRQTLSDYQNKKTSLEKLLQKNITTFDVAQDAFKLFGFNISAAAEPQGHSSAIPAE